MSRRRKSRKVFAHGQAVEVQRDVGAPWEPAIYDMPAPDHRGWHCTTLPVTAAPLWIDSMLGIETTCDNPRAFRSRLAYVPTQRIREPKS